MKLLPLLLPFFALSICISAHASETWPVVTWQPPYNYDNPGTAIDYRPIQQSSKAWRLCIAYPHLKDSYWLNVNFGMVEEAKRLGIEIQIVDAGGYPNLSRQIEQIQTCANNSADALIVGPVSFEGLTKAVLPIAERIPVLATVNDIADPGISAKSGVSWEQMGEMLGQYLAKKHPKGSKKTKIAWLPGPVDSGWVMFNNRGFKAGIESSAIEISVIKWGDTGKEIQRTLVQEVIESHPDIEYIVGNALMAEAAISVLRGKKLNGDIKILSTYLTTGVFRGIRRGRIIATVTDSPVLQGRLSIDQAIRILEQKPYHKHVGPEVMLLEQSNINDIDLQHEFAPPSFHATLRVKNK